MSVLFCLDCWTKHGIAVPPIGCFLGDDLCERHALMGGFELSDADPGYVIPGSPTTPTATAAETTETKESDMAKELCGRGCGNDRHRGRCKGGSTKPGRAPRVTRCEAENEAAEPAVGDRALVSIEVPEAWLNAQLLGLTAERKGTLVSRELAGAAE